MNAKFFKSAIEKRISKKDDQHISPIAGALFAVFSIIAILGAVFGDGIYPDVLIGAWVLGWILISIYFLFAMKVASQWEKVVVLRLGKFVGLKGPGLFWLVPIIYSRDVG